MKFFWKVFFSTMFICISCFSAGSYFLINSNFNSSIEQEKNVAYELCNIVYYSLLNEIKDFDTIRRYEYKYNSDNFENERIADLSRDMNISNINGLISFRLSDENGDVVFSSLKDSPNKQALLNLKDNQKGYKLKQNEGKTYITAFRKTNFMNKPYFVEVSREVSHIFENRQMQFEMFLKITLVMFIMGGLLTAFISKLLIRPIVSLTKATKEISQGNFNKKIDIKGEDEIALLSDNFNKMSHELDLRINELKEEAEKKELFVASFSHELKTPLTSIIGYADMLRSKNMTPEKLQTCANYIFSEGKRLENLSMRLLEMIVLRKQDIKLKAVSANEFITNIALSVKPILADFNIFFTCSSERATIFIDPELMKNVFVNLLDNAKKAVGKDGRISIKGKMSGEDYIISVIDNGKGMEESELSKITQAFYMVDKSRARTEGGSGLGLAICVEILKLHGASIEFKSKPNEGTCVTVTLKEARGCDKT